ncbi:MAG: hypothetical protein ABI797_06020, partial [Chloroflexota bacterium]
GLLLVATVALAAGLSQTAGRTPSQRDDIADGLMSDISVSATAHPLSLLAAHALFDPGVGQGGTRLVKVRVIERLQVDLNIATEQDIVFGAPPRLCLVGADSAPDDAGLEDPCWGSPDLSGFLVDRLSRDSYGHLLLPGGRPISFSALLWRGDARCDYAPGDWTLSLAGYPVVDGYHLGLKYAQEVPLEIAAPPHGPLRLLRPDRSRYCGLATRVHLEQGEPDILSPAE